ncbi:MAG: rhodanese-like domain-containing protein, partial [Xanthomonadales bacterium]|nr:rhodanese-like domain-containing protein [Xanthomonadales bacterium]
HALLASGFVAVLCLLAWSEITRKAQGIKELSTAQAVVWMNDAAAIVDVSAAIDFNKGHIVNARNIAMSRITDPDAEVLKMKDSKVLLVCKTGQTALLAAAKLRKSGIENVAVLKGGMGQWIADQYPVTRK